MSVGYVRWLHALHKDMNAHVPRPTHGMIMVTIMATFELLAIDLSLTYLITLPHFEP